MRQGFRGSLLYTSKQTQKSAKAEWLLLHLLKWCYRLWIQLVIALLAVPILIQVFFNSALVYWLNRVVGDKLSVTCPSALIGASNFIELAVAAAISLFGLQSGAALATVVGVLISSGHAAGRARSKSDVGLARSIDIVGLGLGTLGASHCTGV